MQGIAPAMMPVDLKRDRLDLGFQAIWFPDDGVDMKAVAAALKEAEIAGEEDEKGVLRASLPSVADATTIGELQKHADGLGHGVIISAAVATAKLVALAGFEPNAVVTTVRGMEGKENYVGFWMEPKYRRNRISFFYHDPDAGPGEDVRRASMRVSSRKSGPSVAIVTESDRNRNPVAKYELGFFYREGLNGNLFLYAAKKPCEKPPATENGSLVAPPKGANGAASRANGWTPGVAAQQAAPTTTAKPIATTAPPAQQAAPTTTSPPTEKIAVAKKRRTAKKVTAKKPRQAAKTVAKNVFNFCPKCGRKRSRNENFCPADGQKLTRS